MTPETLILVFAAVVAPTLLGLLLALVWEAWKRRTGITEG